jgi:uncharacterized protein (DUF2235 family)
MAKNIALFSDGTGNSSAKAQKTNVWRLFQAADQTSVAQIAKYDDGVGTSSNKYLAALGGAFGFGLKRNVIDLYKFVCRNYEPGDQIYGFGFSRGAFTIRVLTGLIAREGLVTFRSEQELARHAAAAYRTFRFKAFPSNSPIVWLARKLRDRFLRAFNFVTGHSGYEEIASETAAKGRSKIPIRFLGLWDTVEAYGMPIVELKRAIDWALWPMLFGDMKLSERVERAVHALSLDDERTTFHPLLWDEVGEAQLAASGTVNPGRITQVWFAGVHSNVGGGYPEDQLSLVPLGWIIHEATNNGLSVDLAQVTEFSAAASPFARLYNSRAGFAAYYRYSPRQTPVISYHGTRILSNVHWSVLLRMGCGSDAYAPITLPHRFNVLLPDRTLVELGKLSQMVHNGGTSGDAQLDTAIAQIETPGRAEVALIWDTVFWRRCLYALTVGLTTVAVAFPALTGLLPPKLETAESVVSGPVSALVTAFSAVIPSYAGPWKRSLSTYPLEFGVLLIGIALTLLGSQTLDARIHDRARVAWHRLTSETIEDYRKWRQQGRQAFGRMAAIGVVILVGLALFNPAGLVGYLTTAALLAIAYGLSFVGYRTTSNSTQTRIRSTVALRLARLIRENALLDRMYALSCRVVVPAIFVVALIAAGAVLLNRAAFDVMSSAGAWCHGGRHFNRSQENIDSANTVTFSTDQICYPTGFVLQKDKRYVITIATDANDPDPTHRWFDRDIPTDVLGFESRKDLRLWLGVSLRRWWTANWFQPIGRIGRFGNDEYVLTPIDEVAPLQAPRCSRLPQMPRDRLLTDKVDADLAKRINECLPVPADRQHLRTEIKARRDGELFIYVNDAVFGIPGIEDYFLRNNSGTATVTVERPKTPDP